MMPRYQQYYSVNYPFHLIFDWLSYNGKYDPNRREWSWEALAPNDEKYIKRFDVVSSQTQLHEISMPHPD